MTAAVGVTSKGRSAGVTNITTAGVTTQATGSTFVAGMVWDTTATFVSFVDNKGNVYTQLGAELDPFGGGNSHVRYYYCQNGVGGAGHTHTCTISGASSMEVLFVELTGVAVASFDVGNGANDAATPFASPSISTGQAREILVSLFIGNSGSNPATHAESTGFTIQAGAEETNGVSFFTGCLATRVVSTTGSYNSSFTEAGGTQSSVFIAGFKEAATGGGAQRGLGPGGGPRKNRPRSTRSFASASIAADLTLALTGVAGTGATGTLTPSVTVPLTGNAGTGQVGTVVPSRTVALTGVAGTGAAGTVAPETMLAVTGNSATGQVGNATPSLSVALTGVAGTGQVGNVATSGDLTLALTGVAATGAVGTLAPATSVPVTGISATSAVGSVAPALSLATTGAAATGAPGALAPSTTVALTGIAGTGQVGNVTVASSDVTIALTGVAASGQVGTLVPLGMDVASTASSPAGGSSSFERPQTAQQKRRTEKKLEDDIRRIYRRLTNAEPEIAAAIVEPITSPPAKTSSKAAEVEHRAAQITLARIGVDAEIALRLAEKELETKRAQRAENLRRIALILQLVV